MSQETSPAGVVSVYARDDNQKLGFIWSVHPDGTIKLAYDFVVAGEVEILGVAFDYPEANVKAKQWFGRGPYRVYRNRLEGGVLDLHELDYNDPIPGQTYAYPEFKGYFRDWDWLRLETSEGPITIENDSGIPYLGLYAPRDGDPPMMTFPDTGLAFLEVIPAMGTKFDLPEDLGPQSQPVHVSGTKSGSIVFRFGAN